MIQRSFEQGKTLMMKVSILSASRVVPLMCTIVLLFSGRAVAGSVISAQSGNWSEPSTWVGGQIPSAGDSVIILDGHIIAVDSNGSCATLLVTGGLVESGVRLNSGISLAVSAFVHINNSITNNNPKWLDARDGFVVIGGDLMLTGGSTGNQWAQLLISSGTATVNGSILMNGVRARVRFNSSGSVRVRGNFSSTGVLSSGTGMVIYDGTASQAVGAYTYYNLVIENLADVVLGGNVIVNGNLALINGRVILGDMNLTVGPTGSVSGASALNYLVTNGSGKLAQTAGSGLSVLFPVGTASTYNPVTLEPELGSDVFSASVMDSVSPSSNRDSQFVQRTWLISEASPGANGAFVIGFEWKASSEGFAFVRSSAVCWRFDGISWLQEGTVNGIGGGDPYIATITGVSATGSFALGNETGATSVYDFETPSGFTLSQNYPNPFNPATTIQFAGTSGFAALRVFNLLGQEVATLYSGSTEAGKSYTVVFDAANLSGGVYMYNLQSEGRQATRRMLLLK